MGVLFEELDWRPTRMGDLVLRRRRDPVTHEQVYEVKLGDDFLMSSLWTVGEVELARLGLAAASGPRLDVVVGGLGLGHTAHAALQDDRVRSLTVVDALEPVIEWHRAGLVPLGPALTSDPRCELVHGDFFTIADEPAWTDASRTFDAVLVDIDHSPSHVLDSGHAGFYGPEPLRRLAARLRPGGVFALWSDDPPDDAFTALLGEVFAESAAHVVEFPNPLHGGTAANTVYVAVKAS